MGKESLLLRAAIISMISTSRGSHNVNNPPSRIMMINDPIPVVVGEKKLSPASSVLESAPEKGALFWSELFLLFYPTFFCFCFYFSAVWLINFKSVPHVIWKCRCTLMETGRFNFRLKFICYFWKILRIAQEIEALKSERCKTVMELIRDRFFFPVEVIRNKNYTTNIVYKF